MMMDGMKMMNIYAKVARDASENMTTSITNINAVLNADGTKKTKSTPSPVSQHKEITKVGMLIF
jgi:hypothetical protein